MRLMCLFAGLAGTLAVACFTDSGVGPISETAGSTSAGESSGGDSSGTASTGTMLTTSMGDDTTSADATTSTSGSTCGDGVVSTGEQCDDGNTDDNDFCSPNCERRAHGVFVTSQKWHPGGGLADADGFCQNAASAAGVPGSYVAWLSSSTASAVDRVAQPGALRILRLDAVPVFESPADITSGMLLAPISVDETGLELDVVPTCTENAVWTGTNENGESDGKNCDDWTLTTGGAGTMGHQGATDGTWTNGMCQIDCIAGLHLYCFEVAG